MKIIWLLEARRRLNWSDSNPKSSERQVHISSLVASASMIPIDTTWETKKTKETKETKSREAKAMNPGRAASRMHDERHPIYPTMTEERSPL